MQLHSRGGQLLFALVLFVSVTANAKDAQASDGKVDEVEGHIERKEFDKAISVVESLKDRDELLGRIALAQLGDGDSLAAKSTMRRIQDPRKLSNAANELQAAAGGATGADFQTLINLITSTVEPDSWEELGGEGAIAEFPGGVYVDAKGVLRKIKRAKDARLNGARQVVRQNLDASIESSPNPTTNRLETELRMVSLPRLQRELQLHVALGEPLTDEMRYLAGLKTIEYVFVFPETNDLVIAGPARDLNGEGQAPANDGLLLNDLLTLLENAESSGGSFSCDISPKRTNLARTKQYLSQPTGPLKPAGTRRWVNNVRNHLGLQNIDVRGIDPGSHVARVLVEADYHMKLVGMGLEPSVPEVPSYLASISRNNIPKSMDVLRWWFTLQDNAIERNEQGDSFRIADQVVQLQSENELVTATGQRVHTGKSSPLNQQFADRFTEHFGKLAAKYPVYQQLEQVMRLALVSALIHSDEVQSQLTWDPSWLTSTLSAAVGRVPQEVPSIVNHRVINRRHVIVGVSGGVRIASAAAVRHAHRFDKTNTARSVANTQTAARPRIAKSSEKWWWDAR